MLWSNDNLRKELELCYGTEFTCLKSYFATQEILHQTSCVATPQQNGRVERKNRHILNVARALRFQANLPIQFWGECILTASFLINRTTSKLLLGKTPYEIMFGKQLNYDYFRRFGYLCYAHHSRRDNDKFGERSRKCIFVGYHFGQKGWRVYDMETNEFLVSHDVVFSEMIFPYAATSDPCSTTHDGSNDVFVGEELGEEDILPTTSRGSTNSDDEHSNEVQVASPSTGDVENLINEQPAASEVEPEASHLGRGEICSVEGFCYLLCLLPEKKTPHTLNLPPLRDPQVQFFIP